jgi:O-antigen ligase
MKTLWIVLFSLLFFPNSIISVGTPFGILTTADFIILPFILVTYRMGRGLAIDKQIPYGKLARILIVFLWWATIITLLIPLRYEYATLNEVVFGLLKLGKLALYSLAAFLTVKLLICDDDFVHTLDVGVLIGLVVMSVVFIGSRNDTNIAFLTIEDFRELQYGTNTLASTMALMIIYLVGRYLFRLMRQDITKWLVVALPIVLLGFLFSNGRAAWIGVLMGIVFLFFVTDRLRYGLLLLVASAILVFAYQQSPNFQHEVDKTLRPAEVYGEAFLEQYNTGQLGFDDGSRFYLWGREGSKLIESPILGRGFFHRGGLSGLDWWGSHNFFIQIFLETGIIGGVLMLWLWYCLWRQTRFAVSDKPSQFAKMGQTILLTAFLIAITGEYFYGGLTWFVFLVSVGVLFKVNVGHVRKQEQFLYRRPMLVGK